jgi:hypothetical protein
VFVLRRLAPSIALVCAIVAAACAVDEAVAPAGDTSDDCCPANDGAAPANADGAIDVGCLRDCTDAMSADGSPSLDGDSAAPLPDATIDAPGPTPALGAHALAYYRLEVRPSPLSTAPIATTGGGKSTIVASVGRGDIGAFATMLPFDNKNAGAYPQLGTAHAYSLWPTSGTALYGITASAGGPGHVVSVATPSGDELTLAAVEIVNGGAIHDFKWNEVLVGNAVTSLPVTTTGPATLVAFWWGDANADEPKTAVPNNGFVVVDSILQAGALVQCAVAVKSVAAAGTYDVTWTATPAQGAQLWLVAVQ